MAHAAGHKQSHALEDAALVLLGLAQAAVLTSWGITSATSAVNSLGFGSSDSHPRLKKTARIAGTVGFAVLVIAALARRRETKAKAAREEALRQVPLLRSMPPTQTAEMH